MYEIQGATHMAVPLALMDQLNVFASTNSAHFELVSWHGNVQTPLALGYMDVPVKSI